MKSVEDVRNRTPAGVGAIVPGDIVTGGIEGLGDIDITIGERIGKVA